MLPFPARAQPSAIATAPNVSYPQSNSSGVMALARATTDFGLRFSGADQLSGSLDPNDPCSQPYLSLAFPRLMLRWLSSSGNACIPFCSVGPLAASTFHDVAAALPAELLAQHRSEVVFLICGPMQNVLHSQNGTAGRGCDIAFVPCRLFTHPIGRCRVHQSAWQHITELHLPHGERRRLAAEHRRQRGRL